MLWFVVGVGDQALPEIRLAPFFAGFAGNPEKTFTNLARLRGGSGEGGTARCC